MFKSGVQVNTLHNLTRLLQEVPAIQRAIRLDRTGTYIKAWNTITSLWQKDELRYWDKLGEEHDSERFMGAVKLLHTFILNQQRAAS